MLKLRHKTVAVACFLLTTALNPFTDCQADQVRWANDVEGALQTANAADRLVLMKFTADWCGYCKKMEKTTFAEPSVASLVNDRFVPVLVDADQHKDLVKHLKIRGLPAILVVAPDMQIVERITGYQTAERLLPKLNQVLAAQKPASTAREGVVRFGSQADGRFARPVSQPTPFGPPTDTAAEPDPFANEVIESAAHDAGTNRQLEPNPFADMEPPTPSTDAGSNKVDAATPPAFEGLCLTSVVEQRRLIPGNVAFATAYRGRQLVFASEQQQQKFLSQPDKYWPMLDGACPLTLLRTGRRVTGAVQHAAVFRGRVWLFQSPELMQEFIRTPAEFVRQLP